MKPNPFWPFNHFPVPIGISFLQSACAQISHDHHAIQFNFDDVSGRKRARRRIQQGTAANRMRPTYTLCEKNTRAGRGSARSEVLVTAMEIALRLRFNSSRGEGRASHFGLGFGAATPSTMRPVCNWAPSVERHAHPFFLAPDDVTRPLQLLGLNDQRETIDNGGFARPEKEAAG